MDVELLPILLVVGGAVLLYGAVKNKNPIGVIKAALTGGDLSAVPPLMTGGGSVGPSQADDQGLGGPASVDSIGASGIVNDILARIGVDGTTVIIPYTGHPIGSSANDPDQPGFMGATDRSVNSTYTKDNPRYTKKADGTPYVTAGTGGRGGGGGTF